VQVFDVYEFERFAVPRAGESDFLLVNLFREPIGAPMRPDAINEVITGCARRAGIQHVTPHRLRHAFGSNLADAGAGLDEIATLMGHASMSSSQVYLHPDPARLREAVDRVRSPRELAGTDR
jgi:integrase/recombinase XerD